MLLSRNGNNPNLDWVTTVHIVATATCQRCHLSLTESEMEKNKVVAQKRAGMVEKEKFTGRSKENMQGMTLIQRCFSLGSNPTVYDGQDPE